MRRAKNRKDLTGMRFGRLTVIGEGIPQDNKRSRILKCRCDCGTITDVTYDALVYGKNISCGCRKKECQDNLFKTLTYVDHTCLEWLERRKHRADNTSGFRGVREKESGRFAVSIGFKQKRYYVGTYDTYEEAVEARKKAEDFIYGGFVRAYQRWQDAMPQSSAPEAAQPLVYRVIKGDRVLRIESNDPQENGNVLEY